MSVELVIGAAAFIAVVVSWAYLPDEETAQYETRSTAVGKQVDDCGGKESNIRDWMRWTL